MPLSQYISQGPPASLTPQDIAGLMEEIIGRVNNSEKVEPKALLAPDEATKKLVGEIIRQETRRALVQRGWQGMVSARQEGEIVRQVENRMLGLGFLEGLLPPARTDLAEIAINPDGSVWVWRKGSQNPERADVHPAPKEVDQVLQKILGPLNRRVSEAEPIVSAKLPRTPRLPSGARVNVVAPPIANGEWPAVNIRLYEPRPVPPEQLLAWGELNEEMLATLAEAIRGHLRIMIAGGTATGKTTLLSAIANFVPREERIILVEDPAEIFLDHPHVVSMEARPPSSEGKYGVTLGDLVTTAMRQTPRWLIVGEVRTGQAAVWLLRAQMSDHPGLSTIHADSPHAAVDTLCLLAMMDMNIRFEATKHLITRAIDLFVQVGFDPWRKRRVMRIAEVGPRLNGGDVWLEDIYRYDEDKAGPDKPVWVKIRGVSRRR